MKYICWQIAKSIIEGFFVCLMFAICESVFYFISFSFLCSALFCFAFTLFSFVFFTLFLFILFFRFCIVCFLNRSRPLHVLLIHIWNIYLLSIGKKISSLSLMFILRKQKDTFCSKKCLPIISFSFMVLWKIALHLRKPFARWYCSWRVCKTLLYKSFYHHK